MKVLIAVVTLALALLVSGCGGSEDTASAPEESTAAQSETKAAKAEPPPEDLSDIKRTPAEEAQLEKEYADAGRWKVLKKAAGDRADQLIIPVGTPPEKKIIIRDLRKGKGPTPDKTDQIKFEMLGFDYSEANLGEDYWGEEGGSWWVFGETNEAIQAGLKGMRPGGIRELVLPASVLHDDDAAVYLVRLNTVAKE